MIINIVSSTDLFRKNAWSVQFSLPVEEIKVSVGFNLVPLYMVVTERKQSRVLTATDNNVNYLGLENIESKTGRVVSFKPKDGNDIKSSVKEFFKGDILYGRLRPTLNKVYYNDFFDEGVCTTEIIVLKPNLEIVNPIYLSELLRTEMINKRIVGLAKGAALPRVAMSDLKQVVVPIPSLNKQQSIAEEIVQRRDELEKCIKKAAQIPLDIDKMVTKAVCS